MDKQISIGKEEALRRYNAKWWEAYSLEEAAHIQLFIKELTMPFVDFHAGVEKLLDRSVWTHEFAYADELIEEARTGLGASPLDKILRTHTMMEL